MINLTGAAAKLLTLPVVLPRQTPQGRIASVG